MAIYRRFRVQQKYVNGKPTEEYRLGVEVDGINYHSLEACESGSECTELEYRWVDMESASDYYCDGTNKYKKQKKQQKCVNEETWTDVYPYEYRAGDIIEYDSEDCGYEPTGEYYIYGVTDGHGSISISPSKEYYSSTDIVTITALPSTDYMFSQYNYGRNLNYGSVAYSSVLSLTMSNNWYVSAVFKSAQYKVYDLTTFGGSLSISPSKEYYNPTDIVTITAIPNINYSFSNYSYGSTSEYGQNTTNSNLTLTMSNDWYVRGNFVFETVSGGSLYYSYYTGSESWYDWSKSTLSKGDNRGTIASIIIDYGGVVQLLLCSAFISQSHLTFISLPNLSHVSGAAFAYCESLISFDLLNCTYVGGEAFYSCSKLKYVSLPKCTSVGGGAFQRCSRLPSIDLSNCLYLSNNAFNFCLALSSVKLPLCEYVGYSAFADCGTLRYISLPNCSYIDSWAFSDCSILTFISLPNCLSVGNHAFQNCRGLTSVSLSKCSYIGAWAFASCKSLISIDLPLCEFVGSRTFQYCYSLTSVNLSNCSYVSMLAFENCSALQSIDLPLCKFLDSGAFDYCSALQSIDLPNCSYIGNITFQCCYSLSYVNIPLCSYVGGDAFCQCMKLSILHLPKVTYFENGALSDTFIETLYMDQITSVPSGYDPSINKSYIKSIIIPCGLLDMFISHSIWSKYSRYYVCTDDGESGTKKIFTATDGGGTITLDPEGGKYYSGTTVNIGYSANPGYVFSYFQYGSTPAYGSTVLNESFSLVMNQNWYVSVNFGCVIASGGSLYYSYSNGTEEYYEWRKPMLSDYDNGGSSALIIIDYGGVVQSILSNAFSGHNYLRKIVLPNCASLGSSAFANCYLLKDVDLPNCLSVGNYAFASCSASLSVNLQNCTYLGSNTFYFCSNLESVNLQNCSYIGNYAFAWCSGLPSIDLPNCTYVDTGAFGLCEILNTVNLPKCSYIGDYAFQGCSLLKNINMSLCTLVNNHAFADCLVLSSIDLPNCSYVGFKAFSGCSKLSYANLPLCTYADDSAFYQCDRLSLVNLPLCEYVGGYAFWGIDALISIDLPNCSYLGNSAFYQCDRLSLVNLPLCEYIGAHTFSGCDVLTSINLPNCTSVGNHAFYNCSQLINVSLPKITYIGTSAFIYAHIETLYMGRITSVPSGGDPNIEISYIKSIFIPSSLLDSFVSHSIWSKYSSYFVGV